MVSELHGKAGVSLNWEFVCCLYQHAGLDAAPPDGHTRQPRTQPLQTATV